MGGILRSESEAERVLEAMQERLRRLEARLADRELDLATLEGQLGAFEVRYLRVVGPFYRELDELNARIAEILARLHPEKVEVAEKARQAREKAQRTADEVGDVRSRQLEDTAFSPSEQLKKLYREVAKRVHPDLAHDDSERQRRNAAMVEANSAYERGDLERLQVLLDDWQSMPETGAQEDTERRIEAVHRKMDRICSRLTAIRERMERLENSDLGRLRRRTEKFALQGRDVLDEMARRVRVSIDAAAERLTRLKRRLDNAG